ncbi:MAG TPA: hypothetical protein VFL57_04690, partial [Bryobacteraceae bacterium]|nr:hypothetical protein [Bryobacteraceae bacterium]
LSPNGPVISTLTNPDGTYRIEGIPPGQYLVYVHPLPPRIAEKNEVSPANITYPVNADNRALTEGPMFDTQFFPGVRDSQQAFPVAVAAGVATEGINFTVRARGPLQIHSIETWGFVSQVALKPPYLNPGSAYPFFVARGSGIINGQGIAPGLAATIIGGAGLALKSYSAGFLQLDADVRSFLATGEGARHVMFATQGDLYVLPAAFQVSQSQPPAIASVASASDGGVRVAVISGTGMNEQTRILFDGTPALRQFIDDGGRIIATPPPARGGHRATVVAVNPDGQSSLFVSATPAVYGYEGDPGSPILAFTPNSLGAGVDALITIEAAGTSFVDGATVGFGSPDITVRRTWTVSTTRLIASVSVSPRAMPAATSVTVANGLQTITQPFSFQITPLNPRAVVLSGHIANAVPGAVAIATVVSSPLSLGSAPLQLFLNERTVPVSVMADNQLAFQIPAGTPIGLATLRLQVGGESSLPVAFAIESQPPQITSLLVNGQAFDARQGVRAGDLMAVFVSGLAEANATIAPNRVTVGLGSMQFAPSQVLATANSHVVLFVTPSGVTGTVPLTIAIDGRSSAAFTLSVR